MLVPPLFQPPKLWKNNSPHGVMIALSVRLPTALEITKSSRAAADDVLPAIPRGFCDQLLLNFGCSSLKHDTNRFIIIYINILNITQSIKNESNKLERLKELQSSTLSISFHSLCRQEGAFPSCWQRHSPGTCYGLHGVFLFLAGHRFRWCSCCDGKVVDECWIFYIAMFDYRRACYTHACCISVNEVNTADLGVTCSQGLLNQWLRFRSKMICPVCTHAYIHMCI